MTHDAAHLENGQPPTRYSVKIPEALFEDPDFIEAGAIGQAVLLQLYRHRRRTGKLRGAAWPTMSTVAAAAGLSRGHATRVIKRLREAGLISGTRFSDGSGTRVRYRFKHDPDGLQIGGDQSSAGASLVADTKVAPAHHQSSAGAPPKTRRRYTTHTDNPYGQPTHDKAGCAAPVVCVPLLGEFGISEETALELLNETDLDEAAIRHHAEKARNGRGVRSASGYLVHAISQNRRPTSESAGRGDSKADDTNPCGPPPPIDWSDCKPLREYLKPENGAGP